MFSSIFTPDVIRVLVELSVPVISAVVVRFGVKAFNRYMDYKIDKLGIDEANQNEIARYNEMKIDEYEQHKFERIVRDGVKFAEEVAYRTWLSPDVKEKTGTEKFNNARDYVIEVIKKEFTDPVKRQKYIDSLDEKITAILPESRQQLDGQYNMLKTSYVLTHGDTPLNSRNPFDKNSSNILNKEEEK